jgi:hypothetical protein
MEIVGQGFNRTPLYYSLKLLIFFNFGHQVLHKTEKENDESSSHHLVVPTTTSRELYGLFEWAESESKVFWQDNCGQWLQCRSFNHPHFSLNVRSVLTKK